MTQEQTEAAKLVRWTNIGERGPPVTFVGRKREIDLAIDQLATWRPGASPGRTVVLQGAPGAGKTAVLYELARRLPTALPGAASIYLQTPWADDDVASVLEDLAIRMMGVTAADFRTATSTNAELGVKAGMTARRGHSEVRSPPRLGTWREFEGLFRDRRQDAKPTMLLVDEVQRMEDEALTKRLLFNLHDQPGFPVLLVCGGLSTSAGHLRELGLSRLADANVLRIGALKREEAERCLEESLRLMADDAGIVGHPDHWARRLALATHGWPQHVTLHIRAAAAALRVSERLAFDEANLADAAALAHEAMRQYYEQRLEASGTDALIVFAVHEAVNHGETDVYRAADVVEMAAATLSGHRRKRFDAIPDAMHCVDRMLHSGVVAYAGNTTTSPLAIPIPSMAAHIAGRLSPAQRADVRQVIGLA